MVPAEEKEKQIMWVTEISLPKHKPLFCLPLQQEAQSSSESTVTHMKSSVNTPSTSETNSSHGILNE